MDFSSSKSIFMQIADNITEMIMNGTHPPGDKIPSVRELAANIGVNPNTVMRTYNELQLRKIIENKRGIGYYVVPDAKEKIHEWKKEEFFNSVFPEFARQMAILDISYSDLKPFFDQLNQAQSNEKK
jgi:GntR family transcriptional regulator